MAPLATEATSDEYAFTVHTEENGRDIRTRVSFPGELLASLKGKSPLEILRVFAKVLNDALNEAMVGGAS